MGLFSSNKSSSVLNETENNFYDQRQVNDAGGGVIGAGNSQWVDSSQLWDGSNRSTNNWSSDSSNRSTNNWSSDSSNRSTNNWSSDSSNRSTNNWTQYTTDGGAVAAMGESAQAQTAMAGQIALKAIDAARDGAGYGVTAGLKAQENAIASNDKALSAAFAFAGANDARAFENSEMALGWVGQRFDTLATITGSVLEKNGEATAAASKAASAGAEGTKQTLLYVAGGVVLLFLMMKKG